MFLQCVTAPLSFNGLLVYTHTHTHHKQLCLQIFHERSQSFFSTKAWNAEYTGHVPPPGDSIGVEHVILSMVPTWTPAKFHSCCHLQRSPLPSLLLTKDVDIFWLAGIPSPVTASLYSGFIYFVRAGGRGYGEGFLFHVSLNYNCCVLKSGTLNKSAKQTALPVGMNENEGRCGEPRAAELKAW